MLDVGPPERAARRRQPQGRHRPAGVAALGLSPVDVNTTLSAAWGGRYVNDFVDRGRVKRVYVQGDAPYRAGPRTSTNGTCARPGGDGAVLVVRPDQLEHHADQLVALQRLSVVRDPGQAAPGVSSGEAMDDIERSADKMPGVTVAWSGLSYQERLSGGQAPMLYGVSLIVVFLCLAALYESWSVPFSVLLVIPLGLVGAVLRWRCAACRTTSISRSACSPPWACRPRTRS